MKLALQAIISSVIIHLIYFLCSFSIGYMRTTNYQPDIEKDFTQVALLQNNVGMGISLSPVMLVLSIIGMALIIGIIIKLINRINHKKHNIEEN